MKFENTQVDGFEAAFRGARNPLNSWGKSDSYFGLVTKSDLPSTIAEVTETYPYQDGFDWQSILTDNGIIKSDPNGLIFDTALIGNNDMSLAHRLLGAGTSDSKFMRQINVSVDITGPAYWLN